MPEVVWREMLGERWRDTMAAARQLQYVAQLFSVAHMIGVKDEWCDWC